jgi:hypothetical protein
MEDYQERVIKEKADLDSKIVSLAGFIHSEKFWCASEIEIALLDKQLQIMIGYSKVLRTRIDTWEAQ